MHYDHCLDPNPLGVDKQAEYKRIIQGCVDHYGNKGQRCYANEEERIAMNLRQPKSSVNYTESGFTKIRAPPEVFELIKEFWDQNRNRAKVEDWPPGYVTVVDALLFSCSLDDQVVCLSAWLGNVHFIVL